MVKKLMANEVMTRTIAPIVVAIISGGMSAAITVTALGIEIEHVKEHQTRLELKMDDWYVRTENRIHELERELYSKK